MIPPVLRELEQVFGWLLAASWQASVLALFVLGFQKIFGSRLNPRWRYALWLLVLLRLVLPVLPESTLSLFQFVPNPPAALTVSVTEPWQPLFTGRPYPAPSDPEPIVKSNYPFSYFTLLTFLWLGGAVILLILTWEANRRFARHVANSPAMTDPELLKLFAETQAELGVRRATRLVENGQIQSPAIMGLFQPTLLLPAGVREKFDEADLRLIFLHELAHLKRGDIIVQALIALLQILHWFNPVLWYTFRRMRIDREPATDALVLSRTGEEEKERYGLMLIKLLEHFNQRHSLPTLVGILEDKDQFKRRFYLIARYTRGAYGWSLLGVTCLCALSAFGLTAKNTTSGNSQRAVRTSDAEAAAKGIGAFVNGQAIYWDKLAPDDHQVALLISNYHSDALRQKLAEERYIRRDIQIQNELVLECAKRENYRTPQWILDDKINYALKGFHGDKAAFVENLRKNSETLEQFTEFIRDEDIFYHEDSIHIEGPVDQFAHDHFPSVNFKTQKLTKEQDEMIGAERDRIQESWINALRDNSVIQRFDDPQYPGARPPDFISTSTTRTTKPPASHAQSGTEATPFHSTPATNGTVATAPINPPDGSGARFQDVAVSGKLRLVHPNLVDFAKSDGYLQNVDGGTIEFHFQPDGSFTIPQVKPGVYNRRLHFVPITPGTEPVDLTLESLTVDGSATRITTNLNLDVRIATPPKGGIRIGIKVIEIPDDIYLANKAEVDAAVEKADMAFFNKMKGVDLVSTPTVTTQSGLKADVAIVREFPYPTEFEPGKVVPQAMDSVQGGGTTNVTLAVPPTPREFVSKDIGVNAEIIPTIDAGNSSYRGKIILNGEFTITDFEGFTQTNLTGAKMPSFSTRESHFVEALDDNQQIGILIPGVRGDEKTITDKDNAGKTVSVKTEAANKRLILFLDASLVK